MELEKIWRIFCRTAVCVGIVLVSAIVLAAIGVYRTYYGRHDVDEVFSERIVAHDFYERDEIRIYDTQLGRYVTEGLEWVAAAPTGDDSLTAFRKDGKYGFLDVRDGLIAIEAQYDKAWGFSEGLGAVAEDGKIGFVDARNRIVLPFEFGCTDSWAVDYIFQDGYCPVADAGGRCGVIDRTGKWVVEPQYDCIREPQAGGYRIVQKQEKCGLLGPDLKPVYPVDYDDVDFAADGTGILLTRDGRKWQVDFEGRVVRPFVFDCSYWLYVPDGGEEESGRLSDFMKYTLGEKEGVLRRDNGRVIIPARYRCVNMLSETLFEAMLCEDEWILFDAEGNVLE